MATSLIELRDTPPNVADWHLFVSSRLVDREYAAGQAVAKAHEHGHCTIRDTLHLGVSMRSFRAENVSQFVKHLLDLEVEAAREAYQSLAERYPLVMTRDLKKAKDWLRQRARGSERFGIVVSSQAYRLKPQAIDVRTPVDPIHWFLGPKTDVRSSYYVAFLLRKKNCRKQISREGPADSNWELT